MERNLIVAGFGGQGVMMLGTLLAQATCESTDKHVTYFPSYGAEMRGGTANCYVVISDDEIGAPIMDSVEDLIVMNDPSLVRFKDRVKPGGFLFINSTICKTPVERDDITVVEVPVTHMAQEMGNPKVLNIIMLGAYIGATEVVPKDVIIEAIKNKLGKKKPEFLPTNLEAFEKGYEIGQVHK